MNKGFKKTREFVRELREGPREAPSYAAVALARSAGAAAGAQLRIVPQVDSLEEDGCDFSDALSLYLAALGCPGEVRHLIACITGRTGGSTASIEITDAEVARRAGRGPQWVQRKRKALIAWEQKIKFAVMTVTEGDYDRARKKNRPTRYEVHLIDAVSEVVREARSSHGWQASSRAALHDAAWAVAKKRMQEADAVRQRSTSPRRDPAAVIAASKATIRTLMEKTRDLEATRGGSVERLEAEMRQTVSDVFSETPTFIVLTGNG